MERHLLRHYIINNDIDEVRNFLNTIDIYLNEHIIDENPLLITSIRLHHHKITDLLLQHGADIRVIPNHADARIFIEKISFETLQVLMRHGLEHIPQFEHFLRCYIEKGRYDYLKIMVPHIKNFNHCTNERITYLALAARCGYIEIVELLLDHGADMDFRHPMDSGTALYEACKHRRYDIAEMLIRRGANTLILRNGKKTALEYLRNAHQRQRLEQIAREERLKRVTAFLLAAL